MKPSQKDRWIIDSNPQKIIWAGSIVFFVFFVVLGGIAAFLPFSGAVIAPGVVKVSQERKSIQHLEGGIVDQIFVKEGDKVKKGDILIKLSSSNIKSNVELIKGRLSTKMIEAARYEAQMNFKKEFEIPKELPGGLANIDEVIASEKEMFNKTRKTLTSKLDIQKARIKQIKERIEGSRTELESNTEIIESLEEEIKAKTPLMEEKYLDKAHILTLRRTLSERKGQNARLQQAIAESLQAIEEINLSIVSLENSYREEASANLVKVRDEVFQLDKQLRPMMDADDRLDIKAPVAGTVINLEIHSEKGGVIRPGAPILDIVPENAELIVEASLRQDKITQVQLGQETKVQLAAFNRITTPPVIGKVTYISADSVVQRNANGQPVQQSYIVRISIDKSVLEQNSVWLTPGMPATCYITSETRTFLGYLMEPILLNLDNSLKETL